MPTILAGDVGGTKTLLGLFDAAPETLAPRVTRRFATTEYPHLHAVVETFLDGTTVRPDVVCVGVAGPVEHGRSRLTNVPWTVDASELADALRIDHVAVINDVVATAHAIPSLRPDQLDVLQPGRADPRGIIALVAPGTGLAEATVHRDGTSPRAYPSEAGHADFPARTPRELELVRRRLDRGLRTTIEDVLSGPGLLGLARFTHEGGGCPGSGGAPPSDPAAVSTAALDGTCPRCEAALEMLVEALGAEAGNLGLRAVATGGVFLGGGIPRRILPALRAPRFLSAFRAKAPMETLVDRLPVAVITEPEAALLGAASVARARLAPTPPQPV